MRMLWPYNRRKSRPMCIIHKLTRHYIFAYRRVGIHSTSRLGLWKGYPYTGMHPDRVTWGAFRGLWVTVHFGSVVEVDFVAGSELRPIRRKTRFKRKGRHITLSTWPKCVYRRRWADDTDLPF